MGFTFFFHLQKQLVLNDTRTKVLTVVRRELGWAPSSWDPEVIPCQNLPKEASLLTGGGWLPVGPSGLAFITSSAVGAGGAFPKDWWGLPANQHYADSEFLCTRK